MGTGFRIFREQVGTRLDSFTDWLFRAISLTFELIAAAAITYGLGLIMLYPARRLFDGYMEMHVGSTFRNTFGPLAEALENLLHMNFPALSLKVTLVSLAACTSFSLACHLVSIFRYAFHSRSLWVRIGVWGLIFSGVNVMSLMSFTELNGYEASIAGIVPAFCLLVPSVRFACKLFPELGYNLVFFLYTMFIKPFRNR